MIQARRLEKLLEVIHRQSRLMLKITLDGSHELLVRVIGVLVVIVVIAIGGNRDSLGPVALAPAYRS
jgi:hypothetical protein